MHITTTYSGLTHTMAKGERKRVKTGHLYHVHTEKSFPTFTHILYSLTPTLNLHVLSAYTPAESKYHGLTAAPRPLPTVKGVTSLCEDPSIKILFSLTHLRNLLIYDSGMS